MINLLYSFAIGVSFAFGVSVGAILCSIASRKAREQFTKETLALNNRIEDRLAKYVTHTERIAVATELMVSMKNDEREDKR